MFNESDPAIKKFVEALHRCICHKSAKLSAQDFEDYILENRIIKLFCADKNLTPIDCAAMMNERYNTYLDDKNIVSVLKVNRLSYQDKRREILDWAEETVAAFVKVLESRTQGDFNDYMTVRNRNICTSDHERYKIQERIACLMLYVKHPELDGGSDAATIELFGNVYMKHFLYDASDFLKRFCVKNAPDNFSLKEMTLKDFLLFLYNKYPALGCDIDCETFDEFDNVPLKEFLTEAKTFTAELRRANDADFDMAVEDFLLNDPDAQSMLIAPSMRTPVE